MKTVMTRVLPVAAFLAAVLFFVPKVAPSITAGDAPELALAGATLGVAHPPGYPVFAMVNRAAVTAIPFGNPAYRQNVLSALLIAGGILLLGFLLTDVTGARWASLLPMALLFSPVLQHQAAVTEVFALVFFWSALLLRVAARAHRITGGWVLVAFLCGLAVAVHQILVLLFPALLALRFLTRRAGDSFHPRWWGDVLLFFLMGLAVYAYLPVRSFGNPVLDWENPQTWERFWGVFTRARYGFFQLAQGTTTRGVGEVISSFARTHDALLGAMGVSGFAAALVGCVWSLLRRRSRRFLAVAGLLALVAGPGFFWLSGVPSEGSAVLERFEILLLPPLVILAGMGVAGTLSTPQWLARIAGAALVLAFAAEVALRHRAEEGAPPTSHTAPFSQDLTLRDAGLNILRHLPPEAILFADRADETEFALAYLFGVEERRPDVLFVDANAGVTKSIYGDDYYKIWGDPRLRRRERVEGDIINTQARPVFYATADPGMLNLYRTPRGLLYRAWRFRDIKDVAPFPWLAVTLHRGAPSEERGLLMRRANGEILGASLFARRLFAQAEEAFGLSQLAGGRNRHELMGFHHQMIRMHDEARAAYRRALAAGAVSEMVFSNLGVVELARGRPEGALAALRLGLQHHPHSVDIAYNAAVACWHLRQWDAAQRYAERALSGDPRNIQALQLLQRLETRGRGALRGLPPAAREIFAWSVAPIGTQSCNRPPASQSWVGQSA